MTFDYIALNKSNKKVEGEIVAEDLSAARKRLHGMSLTVLAINKRKEASELQENVAEKKDYTSFEFKGVDDRGKEIIGTIDAKDALRAYIRLKNEFLFDVKYLFDLDADEIEKERQKKQLAKELQQKYELTGFAEKEKETQKEENDLIELEKKNAKKLDFLRNQVDTMIAKIKVVLLKVQNEKEKQAEINQIRTLIGELERIKMSNNIKHIRGMAERILDLAESLFKGKEGYHAVIKQKENLKAFDMGRLQQMQYRELVEIKGISGALDKASKLFKKYVSKIGIYKESKSELEGITDKQILTSQDFLAETDLLDKSQNDLKNSFKKNFKRIFALGKTTLVERKIAWHNMLVLLKVFIFKFKKDKKNQNKQKSFFPTFLKPKALDYSKKDYQGVFIEINHFLGWLICFYLGYFYLGSLVIQKNLTFFKEFFYKTILSDLLLGLLFAFFVFHLLTNLKIKFFRQSFWATFSLLFVGIFSVLFFNLNY